MSNDKPEIDLALDPSTLVRAIIFHVATSLLRLPSEPVSPVKITFEEFSPPLEVPPVVFWLQFGKWKNFSHEGSSFRVVTPELLPVWRCVFSALTQSPSFRFRAFNQLLAVFGSTKTVQELLIEPTAADPLYAVFRSNNREVQTLSITVLREQFTFEIIQYSLIDGVIAFLDELSNTRPDLAEQVSLERDAALRVRRDFPILARLMGPFFRIYANPEEVWKYNPNQPLKDFIPEVLWSWIEASN